MPRVQIMAQTARFVREAGGQAEFVLRVRQAANPAFAFLAPGDRCHAYFRWLLEAAPQVGMLSECQVMQWIFYFDTSAKALLLRLHSALIQDRAFSWGPAHSQELAAARCCLSCCLCKQCEHMPHLCN